MVRRLTPKQIVTSILEPSREFAAGYKPVTVITSAGRVISGVEVPAESDGAVLVVETGESKVAIPRDEIESEAVGTSSMPEGQVDE